MIINLIYDAAAQAAPAAFRNTMQQAANMIASMFTDNITVNLNIDYSGTGGGAAAGPDNGQYVSYSNVYNYLVGTASPGDSSFDYLPAPGSANAPTEVAVWNAQLKAMGLLSPNSTTTDDGSATFATDINPSLLLGVALHELTHAMGRVPYSSPDIMELDRFSSVGNRVYDGNAPAAEASYFSINGGLTKWAQYGVNSDPSDLLNAVNYGGDGSSPLTPNDAFDQFYTANTLQYLTPVDLELMDALGFHLKYDAPAEDAYDFNGGNSGDILVQNASGNSVFANMAGGSFHGWVQGPDTPGWSIVGEGKISGGVDSDIVIQNSSGQILYANYVNGSFSNWVMADLTPGWNVMGVGDVNDDRYADIVIQNPTSGQIAYVNMNNGVFNNFVNVTTTPGWSVVAVADVNYNGYDDIVIQNPTTDQIFYANMAGGTFQNWVVVGQVAGYSVVGTGDITGLGDADIVVQNSAGNVMYANMVGGAFQNWVEAVNVPGWKVIGVEDVTGSGFADIVIQNPTSGQILYANYTGGSFQGWGLVSSAPGYNGVATGPAPTAANASPASAATFGMDFADATGNLDSNTPDQGSSNNNDSILTAFGSPSTGDGGTSQGDGSTLNGMPPLGTEIHLPMFTAWAYLDGDGDGLPPGVGDATHSTASAGNGSSGGSAGNNLQNASGISASWLTEGGNSGWSSSVADQGVSSASATTPAVTADSLQHALKLST
jgi:hypothetical protein